MSDTRTYVIKWSAKEHEIVVPITGTVLCLKKAIEAQIGVKVERQKLLNLKYKGIFLKINCFGNIQLNLEP